MFETAEIDDDGVAAVRAAIAALARLGQDVPDAVRIDRIRLLEELKSAASAAQAAETAAFSASQRAAQREQGVPAERACRGIAGQIGLARRLSPFHAARYVGWSTILTQELPRTFAALRVGAITEWRAMIVARETAWLSRAHRTVVDETVAPHLEGWGDRRVENEVKRVAYRLDPAGYLGRIAAASADRHVNLRPAPDVMSRLTAVVPVQQGVAAYAALRQHADSLIGRGDVRARGQIMADTLIERVTGQAAATDVSVEIQLLMTDASLLGTGNRAGPDEPAGLDEPAELLGYGTIPADVAREIVSAAGAATPMWIRRVFRDPGTGRLAAMDSHRRCFTPAQRRFIVARDRSCRTPWCDATIRHIDHVVPAADGGPTTVANGQGYCAACNYARQAPGWHAAPGVGGAGQEVTVTTPTGHRYASCPPAPPGGHDPPAPAARAA